MNLKTPNDMTPEEAQAIIKANMKDMAKIVQDAVGVLHPELRESEDERIRTFLLDYAIEMIAGLESDISLSTYDGIKGHDPDAEAELTQWQKARAYLEKQKENPKSADSIPSDCVSDAKCEDKSPKYSDSDGTDIRDTPAYWKGWDDAMKQKEQKHPNGCFTCDEYKKGYETGRLNGFTAGYNKAMKEVDQQEQKPEDRFEEARKKYQVEWSEEDERMRLDTIRAFYLAYPYALESENPRRKNIDWLKFLPERFDLQPKQEWSEEDESELTAVIYCVSRAIKASKDENERNSLLSAKKWLQDKLSFRVKSLSPSWKPSEEQMDALCYALQVMNTDLSPIAAKSYQGLQEIQQNLRKLM